MVIVDMCSNFNENLNNISKDSLHISTATNQITTIQTIGDYKNMI